MDSQTAVAVQSLIDSQVITETTTGERFLYSEVLPLNESLHVHIMLYFLSVLSNPSLLQQSKQTELKKQKLLFEMILITILQHDYSIQSIFWFSR